MTAKHVFLWSSLLLLLVTRYSAAQPNAAQPVLASRQQQLANYRNQVLQEKLFVHTDRSFYVAGERLWFRFFYVDGITHRPLDVSRVAYLELLDNGQKAVVQAKIALDSSRGSGSVYLPTSLPSGTYALRAYTQWMKTTSRDLLFEKPITIVNTFRKLDLPLPTDSLTCDAQFFPEGGHLVAGLPGTVAFKLTDRPTGRGVDCRGVVLGPANDTVARFASLAFGMGTFALTPLAGGRYRVLLTDRRGHTLTRPLPPIDETGYTLHLDETGDQLRLTVQTNQPTATTVYLIGHTRQVVKAAEGQSIANGRAQFLLPKSKLGEGISHLTLFDAAGQPVCERLWGQRPAPGLTLQLAPSRSQYAPRDQVPVTLAASDPAGLPLRADASVSVYKIDSLQTDEELTLPGYLWLTSDLRGPVESPGYYARRTGPDADRALDNLLLTHGWRRFRWNTGAPTTADTSQVPEHGGHAVLGRVTDARTGLPAASVLTYLTIPGKSIRLFNSRSDATGQVRFELPDFTGPHDLVLQTDGGDTLHRIDLLNPFTETGTALPLPPLQLSPASGSAVQDRSMAMQVQNSYFRAYAAPPLPSVIDSSAFYGQPDERYLLDTYTRFTVLEEVLSEYVPGVMVRRQGSHFVLRVGNLPYRQPFGEDPLLLLDGVPLNNVDQLMAFSPLKIKSLDVVTRRYMLGYDNLSGIISFKTYKADLAGFPLDPHAVVLEYDGLQARREFYAPAYATPAQLTSRLPDFRNLLYWNPTLTTDATGKASVQFTTSDQEGHYLIVAHALTPDGRAATTTQRITVQGGGN